MSMDFFESQDSARRRTSVLIFYFFLAVVLIVLSVYLVTVLILFQGERWWHTELFFGISVGILAIIGLGSLYKIQALSTGGAAVARMLGGRPVNPDTPNLNERRLLNVVEEMAIASGVPVPEVFLLEHESSINAFAAGFTPTDAAIGVTKGCMELLTREELQGVIAHEYSHILNGDMRLNIRLIGVLHGILIIALMGYWMMRIAAQSSRGRSSRSGKQGGGMLALVLIGLVLMIVGYIGVFFAKLIKAAVSRQREYLADAAAVQFTRNPSGLSGALKKIGGLVYGSRIKSAAAEEASHLFFGNGLSEGFVSLMATHPPLDVRIRRLDPAFDGKYPALEVQSDASMPEEVWGATRKRLVPEASQAAAMAVAVTPEAVTAQVGVPVKKHLDYAASLLESMPPPLREAAHQPFSARAVCNALLLDSDEQVRQKQLQRLQATVDTPVYQETVKLAPLVNQLPPEARLPLVDMALPALRMMTPTQYETFIANINFLIQANEKVSLFEYALHQALLRHLKTHFQKSSPPVVQYYKMDRLGEECSVLLSNLARQGHSKDDEEVRKAFEQGAVRLGIKRNEVRLLPAEQSNLKATHAALQKLALTSAPLKRRILQACVACIGADGRVSVKEAELLRAVADALDCPLPPLVV